MRLLLIRHGQTPSNVDGLLDTRIPGPGLTELGTEQAAAIPAALDGQAIDAIFASVQVRSQITAAPLAAERDLEVQVREGIREIASGDFEMLADVASVRSYMSAVFAWAAGDLDHRLAGGESGTEVFDRFNSVVNEAFEAGYGTAAIVAHGAIIRAWVGFHADNVDADFIEEHPLGNTGIVVLDGSPEFGWSALTWMDEPLGGAALDDPAHDGPSTETI